MEISIINMQSRPIDAEFVRQAVARACGRSAHTFANVSIVLVDDAHITELNRDHRGIDGPTDVLSYESDGEEPEYMGDVLISTDTAHRQAEAAGRSLLHEVSWLGVHGVLHLLGHNDVDDDERAEMIRIQDQILREAADERDADA